MFRPIPYIEKDVLPQALKARVGKSLHMSWTWVLLLTEQETMHQQLHIPAKSQASSIPISLGSTKCVTITLCFAVSVQSPGLPAELELHWLHHPGLQVSVGSYLCRPYSHVSENSDKPHQEGELIPVLLFKASTKRNWFLVKDGFSSGIAAMFWVFKIQNAVRKEEEKILFNHSFGPKEKKFK